MNDTMNTEERIDKEFNIETSKRDATKEDDHHRAYEATPYDVLDLLAEEGVINRDDVLVDMGCGKGRAGFYLSNRIGCRVKGIEYSEELYQLALQNQQNLKKKADTQFLCMNAENYEVQKEDNVFFFFNPFSIEILRSVIANIEKSYYENRREIKLIFYYPSMEYVGYLLTKENIEFIDEIDCSHLYKKNKERECLLLFRIF